MIYNKPTIITVQISAPPLSSNFAPPPISMVSLNKKNLNKELCSKIQAIKLNRDQSIRQQG